MSRGEGVPQLQWAERRGGLCTDLSEPNAQSDLPSKHTLHSWLYLSPWVITTSAASQNVTLVYCRIFFYMIYNNVNMTGINIIGMHQFNTTNYTHTLFIDCFERGYCKKWLKTEFIIFIIKACAAPWGVLLSRELSLCLAGPWIPPWRNCGNSMLQMVLMVSKGCTFIWLGCIMGLLKKMYPNKHIVYCTMNLLLLSSSQCVSPWLFQLQLLTMSSCVHCLQWQTLPHLRRTRVWLPFRLSSLPN